MVLQRAEQSRKRERERERERQRESRERGVWKKEGEERRKRPRERERERESRMLPALPNMEITMTDNNKTIPPRGDSECIGSIDRDGPQCQGGKRCATTIALGQKYHTHPMVRQAR